MAWHILRLAWANIPYDDELQKYPYIAEFIDEQDEVNPQVLDKVINSLLESDILHNPEAENKQINRAIIQNYLNKEVFINGYYLDTEHKIQNNVQHPVAWTPSINVNINPTMNQNFQGANGDNNQQANADNWSAIDQTASFDLKYSNDIFAIKKAIEELLLSKNIESIEKQELLEIQQQISLSKTVNEKKSVISRIWSLVSKTLKDSKDYLELAKLIVHFNEIFPSEMLTSLKNLF